MSYHNIIDGVYLGDFDSWNQVTVDEIINVSEYSVAGRHNYPLSLHQDPKLTNQNMKAALQSLIKFREEGKTVLVHCIEGVSRSAAVVLSYLINHLNMDKEAALKLLQSKRPQVNINPRYLDMIS